MGLTRQEGGNYSVVDVSSIPGTKRLATKETRDWRVYRREIDALIYGAYPDQSAIARLLELKTTYSRGSFMLDQRGSPVPNSAKEGSWGRIPRMHGEFHEVEASKRRDWFCGLHVVDGDAEVYFRINHPDATASMNLYDFEALKGSPLGIAVSHWIHIKSEQLEREGADVGQMKEELGEQAGEN
ncbi:MAG: hypothetical protein V1875_06495 [Candidatus Altiarchaeota archaeon]